MEAINGFLHQLDAHTWVAVAFVTFVLLAGKKIWRALGEMVDARTAKIARDLDAARRLRGEAEAMLAAYKQKEAECLKEAEAIVAKARDEADMLTKQAEKDLTAAIEARTKVAMDRIEQEELRAIGEVQNHMIDLSIAAARSLITDQLKKSEGSALAKAAAADILRKLH